MTEEGSLDEDQGDLISSALQFGDVTVESILTARVDLAAIDVSMSHAEILSFIKEQRHSRLPVYEGSIDNIIGILQIRTYIKAYLRIRARIWTSGPCWTRPISSTSPPISTSCCPSCPSAS
jgi:putative hemolysin